MMCRERCEVKFPTNKVDARVTHCYISKCQSFKVIHKVMFFSKIVQCIEIYKYTMKYVQVEMTKSVIFNDYNCFVLKTNWNSISFNASLIESILISFEKFLACSKQFLLIGTKETTCKPRYFNHHSTILTFSQLSSI